MYRIPEYSQIYINDDPLSMEQTWSKLLFFSFEKRGEISNSKKFDPFPFVRSEIFPRSRSLIAYRVSRGDKRITESADYQ